MTDIYTSPTIKPVIVMQVLRSLEGKELFSLNTPVFISPTIKDAISSAVRQRKVLEKLDASNIILNTCSLVGIKAPSASFNDAVLRNVTFEDGDLSNATFEGAILENVFFTNCKILGVDFSKAKSVSGLYK